jgi:hypothetical protein
MMGEKRNAYSILVGKPEGRTRRRCVCNVKILVDFREVGWGGVDWIDLAQDWDQCMALIMNFRVS